MKCNRQLSDAVLLPKLGIDVEVVSFVTKETCLSPKNDFINCLKSDATSNNDVVNKFKQCKGKKIFRISDVDKDTNGTRANGYCVACKKSKQIGIACCAEIGLVS